MISLFLSSASRKAWVAGLLAALLTPVHELLGSGGEITLRTLGVAALSGLLSAAVVFATTNTPPGEIDADDVRRTDDLDTRTEIADEPGQHAADR